MKLPRRYASRQIILAATMIADPHFPRRPSPRPPPNPAESPSSSGRRRPGAREVTVQGRVVERLPDGPLRDRFAATRHPSAAHAVRAQGRLPTASRCSSSPAAATCAWSSTRKESKPPSGSPRAVSRRGAALSHAGAMAGRRRRCPGARRDARHAAAAQPAARRRHGAAHRRHGFFRRRPSVRAADHRAGSRIRSATTRPTICPARPDFAVLMYPVIATTGRTVRMRGSAQQLLAARRERRRISRATRRTATSPPRRRRRCWCTRRTTPACRWKIRC